MVYLQLDLVEKKAKNWHDKGSVPSEPFFVPRPGATEEDDGELVISSLSHDNQPQKTKESLQLLL